MENVFDSFENVRGKVVNKTGKLDSRLERGLEFPGISLDTEPRILKRIRNGKVDIFLKIIFHNLNILF